MFQIDSMPMLSARRSSVFNLCILNSSHSKSQHSSRVAVSNFSDQSGPGPDRRRRRRHLIDAVDSVDGARLLPHCVRARVRAKQCRRCCGCCCIDGSRRAATEQDHRTKGQRAVILIVFGERRGTGYHLSNRSAGLLLRLTKSVPFFA